MIRKHPILAFFIFGLVVSSVTDRQVETIF